MAHRNCGGSLTVLAFAAVGLGLSAPAAWATDGYFQNGYGARHQSLAGAGAASSTDATAAALNPAGLVHAPSNEFDVSLSLFMPYREVTGGGTPGITPLGTTKSQDNIFYIPNMAWSKKVNTPLFDTFGLTVYGNGGMETNYPAFGRPAPNCSPAGGSGVFCFGQMGISLQQMLISAAFAKTIAPGISVGVAPILARQTIEVKGLGAFGQASNDVAHLSDQGTNEAWGSGVRAGVEAALTNNVRFGLTGSSPIYMQKFNDYRGLFADQGAFNIPASLQAGVAVDVMPSLTLMADYKHIWYGSVASIANPSANILNCPGFGGADPSQCLGGANGPGFGWKDVDVIKLGAEWRTNTDLTLRAGYSYNTNPITSPDVMFNIIAPGVVQNHFTTGFQYRVMPNMDFELDGIYVPRTTVSGTELPGFATSHTIDISMQQFEVTAGIKYRLGQ